MVYGGGHGAEKAGNVASPGHVGTEFQFSTGAASLFRRLLCPFPISGFLGEAQSFQSRRLLFSSNRVSVELRASLLIRMSLFLMFREFALGGCENAIAFGHWPLRSIKKNVVVGVVRGFCFGRRQEGAAENSPVQISSKLGGRWQAGLTPR